MAHRFLTAAGLALLLLLSGCGSAAGAGSADGSASSGMDAGSAAMAAQAETPADEQTEQQAEELPLAGVTICLDAGHGITDAAGTERVSPLSQETKAAYVSGASGSSQTEEEVNLAVALLTQTELEKLGAQVVMTRQTHAAALSNQERARIANEAGADLCIRIHADGSEDGTVSGMSMQVPSGDLLGTPAIETPSAQAAEIILQAVTEQTGARSRGLTKRSDLTGFNWSEVPCVLLEMGFLSNEEEDARLASQEYREQIAAGIASGVLRWHETMK